MPTLCIAGAEALVGNRLMTVRVDSRGSTYDVYFPTVGLRSSVRPRGRRTAAQPLSFPCDRRRAGGRPAARLVHGAGGVGALSAVPGRHEPADHQALVAARADQRDDHRHGRDRRLPAHQCGPGNLAGPVHQTILDQERRRREPAGRSSLFTCMPKSTAGVGDVGFSWHDSDRAIRAINRGHPHANRKLARDATIEFALALDDRGEVECEPTGPE